MGKYYVAGIPFDSENSLKHYGVKGQEWGKHKFGIDADDRYIKWLKNAGQNIGRFTTNAAQNVARGATAAARTVGSAVNKGANFVGGAVSGAAQNVGNATSNAANDARNWVNQAGDNVRNGNVQRAVSGAAQNVGNFLTGNQARQDLQDAQNSFFIGRQGRVNAAQDAYNQTLPGMIENAANDARNWVNQAGDNVRNGSVQKAVSGAVNDARNWVNQAGDNVRNGNVQKAVTGAANDAKNLAVQTAQNVGDAANRLYRESGLSSAVDRVGNALTGNIDRNTAEGLRRTADHQADPNAAFHSPLTQYSPENLRREADEYQQKADNALFPTIGRAAQNVSNVAKGAINSAGQWVNNAAGNAGKTAQNAGNTAKGFINSAGQWVSNAAGNVGKAAQNVGNVVSGAANDAKNWAGQTAQNVGNAVRDFVDYDVTGNGYRQQAQDWRDYLNGNPPSDNMNASNSSAEKNVSANEENANNSLFGRIGKAVSGAANDAKNWAGQAAQDVGNAVSGAANAVGDWAGNVFNREEGQNIPVNSQTEQRVNQDRINKIQEAAEYYYNHPEKFNQGGRSNAANNASQSNAGNPVNGNGNPIIIGNDPDMMGLIETLYNSNHPMFGQLRGGQASSNPQNDRLADKPDGVSDEFWDNYKYNGGTREEYDAQRAADKQRYEREKQQNDSRLSDKPEGVSDDYWRDFKFNGGTREEWDARQNARTSSQPINNTPANAEPPKYVDSSRPFHFEYDQNSGQTIVVYDD